MLKLKPAARAALGLEKIAGLHEFLTAVDLVAHEADVVVWCEKSQVENLASLKKKKADLAAGLQLKPPARAALGLERIPGLAAWLDSIGLKAQLPRLRERALHALCRAYLPALPLTLLARRLGWADDTRGCEQFLRSVGTVPSRASGSSEAQLDTKAALHTLAERAAAARAEAEREELAEQARLRGHGRHIPLAEWQVGPAVPHEFLGGMDW